MSFVVCLMLVVAVGERVPYAQVEPVHVGQRLPVLKGDLLTGDEIELPAAAGGKITLLVLGFTYDSRFDVEAWSMRFREAFAAEPGVTFFEVPMLGGMARLGRWFIDSGMRRGTPKELHGQVLTVYGGVGDWKKRLSFDEKREDAAHLVLLDSQGVVRWLHAGELEDESFGQLVTRVRELLGTGL